MPAPHRRPDGPGSAAPVSSSLTAPHDQAGVEPIGADAIDWLLRVDRRTLALTAPGRIVSIGGASAFIAGEVSAAYADVSDGRSLLSRVDVARALVEGGESRFSALRGQFALAVSDPSHGVVHVLRDPLGAHPLFYVEQADAVLFAPRPRVLLAHPGVSRTLSRVAIADHLCKRWPDDHETFFEAVRRVPPGWQITISASAVSKRRYWSPTADPHDIDWLADDEAARFDVVLDQAVARALNRHRAGIFLSGGIDSVSVAAVARDLAASTKRAVPIGLSLGFPDPDCDERAVQTSVATQLGLPLELVDLDATVEPDGLIRRGLELNAELDAPLFNSWMPAYLALVDRGRNAGIDTILTGEGGDEWLGTSPFLAADLWLRGDLAGLYRMARTWNHYYRMSIPWSIFLVGWRYGLRPVAGMACHAIGPRWWDDTRARKVVDSTPGWISRDPTLRAAQFERARQQLTPANPPGGFYSRESRQSIGRSLTSWLFEEQFILGRPRGIRYVHPYWDPDVVSHVYRIRPDQLNAGNRTKAPVRQMLARRFPTLGFERQRKVGALDFFSGIVRREVPPLVTQFGDFRGLASLGVVDAAQTRAYVDNAWQDSAWHTGAAWNMINMEAWVRRQLD